MATIWTGENRHATGGAMDGPQPKSEPKPQAPMPVAGPSGSPVDPAPIVGPPEPALAPSPLAGLAISSARRIRRPGEDYGVRAPGMIYSHRMLQEYRQQTRAYREEREQTKADADSRQSVPEDEMFRAGPLDTIEPPFSFDALTTLLFDAPDFYAIIDRIAQDVCGPWTLVDAEEVAELDDLPERDSEDGQNGDGPFTGDLPGDMATPQIEADLAGNIPPSSPVPSSRLPGRFGTATAVVAPPPPIPVRDRTRDDAAIRQRRLAKELLEGLTFDLSGTKIKLREFSKMVIKDYKATGNGGIEVARDAEGRVKGLIYIPFRLIRKLVSNRGWVQIDHENKPAAYFRNYGSEPDAEDSRLTETEIRSRGRQSVQKAVGEIKTELYHLKHHHPNEINYGVPPIIPALGAVCGNMHADARNLRYFLNRAVPDYLTLIKADTLTLTGEGTREILDKFEQGLDEQLQLAARGSDYENATIRIPSDVMEFEMKPLGSAINDAEFRGYKTDNRDTQMRVYGMPPHRLGIIETASLGTGSGETQEETYKRAIIDPDQEMLEDLFNAILDEYELKLVRFKLKDIDIVDEKREMDLYTAAVNGGDVSTNEGRQWLSRITNEQDFPVYDADPQADVPKNLRAGVALVFAG